MTLQPPTGTPSQAYLAAPQTTTCRSRVALAERLLRTARQEQTSAEQEQAERLARDGGSSRQRADYCPGGSGRLWPSS